MADDSKKMLTGSLWKGILLFSLPLFVSNLLQVLFNMTDVAVIGKFSSPEALGAVGSTTILVTLFTGFLIGLGNGINVLIARYLGQRNSKNVHDALHTSFVLSIIMGIILFLLGFFFSKYLLIWLKTKDEFIDGATLYLKIYFIGMPANALYNFGNACYSAKGNTKRPLIFLGISGIFNVGLDLLFVIAFKMSVEGVALASIISQYISAFLLMISLMKENTNIKLIIKDIRLYDGYSHLVLSLGLPSGFQSAIFAIANLFIQSGVNSFDGGVVKGNSAAQNADSITFNVMAAFYTACASYMSQNFGADNQKRVKQSYLIALVYSFLTGVIMGLFFLTLGRPFLRIFTNEEQVVDAGYERLKIMAFSYTFSAFMDNTIAASRGIGKSFIPTIIVITGSCVFRVIWVYTIFAYFHTITSLYLVYIFSWVITAIFEIAYFLYAYKRELKKSNDGGSC
mgnify:FL=1